MSTILYAFNTSLRSGVPQHVLDLIMSLKDNYRIIIVAPEGEMIAEYKKQGVTVFTLGPQHDLDFGYISRLKTILIEEKVDILHTHMLKTTVNGLIAGFLAKTQIRIAHIHGTLIDWEVPFYKKYLNVFINSIITNLFATKVIALTQSIKQDLFKKEFIQKNKIVVIPNGIPISKFQTTNSDYLRQLLKVNKKTKIIGTLSRLSIEKGQQYFIEAIPKILTKFPDIKFVIVGDGDQKKNLINLTKELNVEPSVTFLGYQPEDIKKDILASFDIFVFPSIREGFGIAMVEAMACRTPVICSDIPILQDIITDKLTGLLFKNKNTDSLANAVLTLIEDNELANKLKKNGEKLVKGKYTLKQFKENYDNLYKNLLK